MTTVSSRKPPDPRQYGSLFDWAAALRQYLEWSVDIKRPTEPEVMLLAHRIGGGNIGAERATVDGLLMYDPNADTLTYSVNGDWQTVLPTSGGTITGQLKVNAPDPTGQPSIIIGDGGDDGIGWDTGRGAVFFENGGPIAHFRGDSNERQIIRQAEGDDRYLRLSGGVCNGKIYNQNSNAFCALRSNDLTDTQRIEMLGGDASGTFINTYGWSGVNKTLNIQAITYDNNDRHVPVVFKVDGAETARVPPRDKYTTGSTLLRRDVADGRYQSSSSDIALKTNVADMPGVGPIIDALRPVTFEWKPSEDDPRPDGQQFGLIAQEVETVLPSAVQGEDGNKGVDALTIIGVLLKAVQELTARVEALETNGGSR